MAAATITPSMRSIGWNVRFFTYPEELPFAGLYQTPESDLVTFRNAIEELRLCFEIPSVVVRDNDPWNHIAFGLIGHPPGLSPSSPIFVTENEMGQPVPGLPARGPRAQSVVKYQVVLHGPCAISSDKPVEDHLKAQCAQHLPQPVRRVDPRYLPPKGTSSDPRYAVMPFRRALKGRSSSQSPPKRSSGSVSPSKENETEDVTDLIAPPTMVIDVETARKTMASFRSNCLINADHCAVSGKGQPWCNMPVGPALHACHIIPQQHYHLYPDRYYESLEAGGEDVEFSPNRLREAWRKTWQPSNGIVLMSHLHELFDARLFSIHPVTLRIRAFVPYDVVIEFNGRLADVPDETDRNALRHHYEMCCIENMAAKMGFIDLDSASASKKTTPGIKTPVSGRINLQMGSVAMHQTGDPSKRARLAQDDAGRQDEAPGQIGSGYGDTDIERPSKRKRRSDIGRTCDDWLHQDICQHDDAPLAGFLADVNWELHKFKANQVSILDGHC